MTSRPSMVDVLAQLRRRWSVVFGGALLGLVTGIAIGSPAPTALDVAVSVAVGIVLGFVVALVLVHLHPRVATVHDVRRVTGLPVVAQLPRAAIDSDDPSGRPTSRRMRTTLREAVMNLRVLDGGSSPERIVLARTDSISESSGVDGGLARALVESGSVTALLHTDLESRMVVRPSTVIDSPFDDVDGLPRPDSAGYERVPVTDRVASAVPRDALGQMERLLVSLGERYDVTIAQAASNSEPVPLRGIAPAADVVLLVVQSNKTTVEALLALYSELLSIGVEPLGVILTGVASRHRVLLRSTWMVSDFRGPGPRIAALSMSDSTPAGSVAFSAADVDDQQADMPRLAGFSIADLTRGSAHVTDIGRPAVAPKPGKDRP